jgi:hypothetical protein
MSLFVDLPLPHRSGSLHPSVFPLLAPQQITRLALQSTAQFVQDVGAVHPRAIVVQTQQCGVANTSFLSQAVQRPSLLRKDLSKPASDHASRVAGANCVCQVRFIYKLWFTLESWRSRLVVSRKGLRRPSLQWKTTETSPGFPAFAAEVQP